MVIKDSNSEMLLKGHGGCGRKYLEGVSTGTRHKHRYQFIVNLVSKILAAWPTLWAYTHTGAQSPLLNPLSRTRILTCLTIVDTGEFRGL